MEKKYTYDAFISYRHTEPDKFVAENLHKYMETFKLPKSILKSGRTPRTRIERVFRDKDELPLANNLEDPIVNALMQSEYLIVICSPRLKESVWCQKEIETFIEYHGRENILAVLVEGEPEESFPEELLYIEETVEHPDGTSEVIKKPVEPLAADVRGNSKKEILKAMKSELLRLLAPMFHVSYDDLRQRHKERKLKKIIAASLSAAVLCLLIGLGSTIAALQIKKQKEQIEKQANEISAQADEIKEQNGKLLENQAKSLAEKALDLLETGDRMGAVQTAGWAMSQYDGITMPYTPEAKYALTESLHVYDSGNVVKAQYQLAAAGVIDFIMVSPDRKTVVTFDSTTSLCIWDIASGALLDSLSDMDILFQERHLVFVDNDTIAYLGKDDSVHIYRISEKKVTDTIAVEDVTALASDSTGKYLAVSGWRKQEIYDISTLQLLYTFDTKSQHSDINCYFSGDDIAVYTETPQGTDETDSEGGSDTAKTTLYYVNLADGTVYATQTINYNHIKDIYFMGQQAYVNANRLFDDFRKTQSGVIACNVTDGTILWEYELDGKIISDIELPYLEDAEEIMIYTSEELHLLDKNTGRETGSFSAGSSIAGSGVFKDSNRFLVFSRSGEFGMLNTEDKELFSVKNVFDCKSQNVKIFEAADGCFLVLPYNDNRITVYKTSQNPDITPYEGELVSEDNLTEEDKDLVAEAEKLGLENAALVTQILYTSDKSVIFVSYSDATLEIYHATDMILLETISNLQCDINQYLGTDKDGNIYIAGGSYGYCLDSNYRLIAKIEKLLMVDVENNQLIVGNEESMFTLPIYTTEELLDMIPADNAVSE